MTSKNGVRVSCGEADHLLPKASTKFSTKGQPHGFVLLILSAKFNEEISIFFDKRRFLIN